MSVCLPVFLRVDKLISQHVSMSACALSKRIKWTDFRSATPGQYRKALQRSYNAIKQKIKFNSSLYVFSYADGVFLAIFFSARTFSHPSLVNRLPVDERFCLTLRIIFFSFPFYSCQISVQCCISTNVDSVGHAG